ncbi:hypothetical protein LAM21_25160, partial [Mycobacterium tuberculosis]|nr:hypothetical protein [Mycobacterium tuberculosis]
MPVEAPFPDVTTTYEEIPAKRPLADLIAEARATAKDPADRYNPNIDYFEEWDAGVKAKGWR